MADIRFERVRKEFDGGVVALEEFSLQIPSPRLVVLVGPSGCGKTTLLRLIAGLEKPTSGAIYIGGERLDTVEPRNRDVAMVFQNYALYPHMTVRENLSFGLKIRRVPRDTIVKKVEEVSRSLEIHQLLDRRPAELSGGQRQRVALGRAVVREPRVFLFDEPLSNLDARLRDDLRYMIKKLYQRLRTTTVYVTHDQVEAMTIGETLVVLKDGRIHQVGSPAECYFHPEDSFVASFLGSPPMNLLSGSVDSGARTFLLDSGPRLGLTPHLSERLARMGSNRVTLGVRPEDVTVSERRAESAPMMIEGTVIAVETLGHEILAHVDVGGAEIVVRGRSEATASSGERVTLLLREEAIHLFSGKDGSRLEGSGDAGVGVAGSREKGSGTGARPAPGE